MGWIGQMLNKQEKMKRGSDNRSVEKNIKGTGFKKSHHQSDILI